MPYYPGFSYSEAMFFLLNLWTYIPELVCVSSGISCLEDPCSCSSARLWELFAISSFILWISDVDVDDFLFGAAAGAGGEPARKASSWSLPNDKDLFFGAGGGAYSGETVPMTWSRSVPNEKKKYETVTSGKLLHS